MATDVEVVRGQLAGAMRIGLQERLATTLSAREREVLAQVARGASNRDIADRLSISEAR